MELKKAVLDISMVYIVKDIQGYPIWQKTLCPDRYSQSVQFSSDQSLSRVQLFATQWTAARQPPCPSPTPGVYSNSSPLSQWCHPTISSSVIPFSSRLQSFPASEYFPVSHVFASGGQSIGVSALASVLMNIQGWFPLGLTGRVSLQFKRPSSIFSRTTVLKASICCYSAFFILQLSHPYRTTGKILALTIGSLLEKWHLCFLIYYLDFFIAFLTRDKHL